MIWYHSEILPEKKICIKSSSHFNMFQKVSASMWRLVLNSLKEHSKPSEGTLKIDEFGHYLATFFLFAFFDHFTQFWAPWHFLCSNEDKTKKTYNLSAKKQCLAISVWHLKLASQLCSCSVPSQTLSLSDGGANKPLSASLGVLISKVSPAHKK